MLAAPPVRAQGWGADLYAGGTRYHALAEQVAATNLIANVRYQGRGGGLAYLSLAAPVDASAVLWSAAGLGVRGERRLRRSAFTLGPELGLHGYAFRDGGADFSGAGGALETIAFLNLSGGSAAIEARGGYHQHRFRFTESSGSREVNEVGLRGTALAGSIRAQADLRWLFASEADYPYVGLQASTSAGRGRVWAWAGKWLADELDDAEWGVGGGLSIGALGELWLTVRQDGGDPLYLSGPRRAWNVGFSRALGRPRPEATDLAPRIVSGRARIRLPAGVVDSGAGTPAVAGEFSAWTATPMRLEGSEWVLDLTVAPGVYRFSFVDSSGEWFVPDGYPGRMDDGMGGYVALMVVP
jgi:hypothetical protein